MNIQMEEMCRVRCVGRGVEFPWSQGVPLAPHDRVFSNLEAPWNPCYWNFMEASSRKHGQLLTPFSAVPPCLENERWAENCKLLMMAWSFWWPAPTQEPPRVTSLAQKMPLVLLSLRKLQGLWGALCQKPGQRPMCVFSIFSQHCTKKFEK